MPLDVGLCERCNPLGLRDASSSQVHGIAIAGVILFVVFLAIAGRFVLAGIGPFAGSVTGVVPDGSGLAITLSVTNRGTSAGQTTCRVTDPADRTGNLGAFLLSPSVDGGKTVVVHRTHHGAGPDRSAAGGRMQRAVTASAPTTTVGPAADDPPTAWRDELAFSLDIAERAGAVLMDRYERLERIDYKSARDVVTEADHLSEALILEAIRARYPG